MADKKEFQFILIGAALPRCGTTSLKNALEKILPGRCMHMTFMIEEPKLSIEWLSNKTTDEEFKNFFRKHNLLAGADMPFVSVYKRVMKVFPDAKVLLLVRDDPEGWVSSMKATVIPLIGKNHIFSTFPNSLVKVLIDTLNTKWSIWFNYISKYEPIMEMFKEVEEGNGVRFYNDFLDDAKKTVPAERLFIYNIKQGWKPLCTFLDVPIPDEDFPRRNGTDIFYDKYHWINYGSWVLLFILLSIPLILGVIISNIIMPN